MAAISKLSRGNLGRMQIFKNGLLQQPSDLLWFLVSFILFLLLGPFSAPIALMFVLKEGRNEGFELEPEPVKLG